MRHFKFAGDWKQLSIAFLGAFSVWAARGFSTDISTVSYILVGFITGGIASLEAPGGHMGIPYAQNHDETPHTVAETPIPTEGADVVKIIKINSGLLK